MDFVNEVITLMQNKMVENRPIHMQFDSYMGLQ